MSTLLATFHKPINCRAINPKFQDEESAKVIAIQTETGTDKNGTLNIYTSYLVVFHNMNLWMDSIEVKLQP
jgi:hypothetical protein